MAQETFIEPSVIRRDFSRALSLMYQAEVPLYGKLLKLVDDVNQQVLLKDANIDASLEQENVLVRLNGERHGAIRLGSRKELSVIRRIFAVMAMYPVGYYDLTAAGLPVHSTAFRPIDEEGLHRSPFRVFTSLLRLDLIVDKDLREEAAGTLAQRNIFTRNLLALLDIFEKQGGLFAEQANTFICEAAETFRWDKDAHVTAAAYYRLNKASRLIADVVSFRKAHLNHLTPCTLDIDMVQDAMLAQGMTPKEVIEGPPRRKCPILLRQTSFKAQEEVITFATKSGGIELGCHMARFGEVEQRGAALKPKGRQIYDEGLQSLQRNAAALQAEGGPSAYMTELAQKLTALPDDWSLLRADGLAYFQYRATAAGVIAAKSQQLPHSIETLIECGYVDYDPIVYEDFLPVSAAGIFHSNLDAAGPCAMSKTSQRIAFEEALGTRIIDEFEIYAHSEQVSIDKTFSDLGFNMTHRHILGAVS